MEPKRKSVSTAQKRGRPPKVEREPGQLEWDFDAVMQSTASSEDATATLLAMLQAHRNSDGKHWRGLMAVPPGTLLELILSEFTSNTNISQELVFFTFFSIVSGYLLRNDVHLETPSGRVDPDIWTVLLGGSGAGKTWTQKNICDGMGDTLGDIEVNATSAVSSAAFVETLSEMPRGLWIRDEFAQFLKAISTDGGPLAEMKDVLLRLYDNSKLERRTKKEVVTVDAPALTILGLTARGTFAQYITAEMMLDGFAQRFSYVIAEDDPSRHFLDYPEWSVDKRRWKPLWERMVAAIQPVYRTTPDVGGAAFRTTFRTLYAHGLPESFYRRILWKAHKYALIYHVIRGDTSEELTAEDYGWAARALSMHIDDAAKLIGEHGLGDLERLIQAGERVARRVMIEEGRPVKARDLIRGISNIKNVSQADSLLRVMTMMRPDDEKHD